MQNLLRSNAHACVPNDDMMRHEFLFSDSVEEITPIFDAKGNKIREIKEKKVKRTALNPEEWENRGIKADLFSLENQIANGVQMHPFSGDFIGLDLSDSAQLGEEFINKVNEFRADKSNYVEQNNNENNENNE